MKAPADNRPRVDPYWSLLWRITRRQDATAFAWWLGERIKERRELMRNDERRIYEKAIEHVEGLFWDCYDLEKELEAERAAHRSERLANIELSRRGEDLTKRVELLERQNDELRAFLDSGEIPES